MPPEDSSSGHLRTVDSLSGCTPFGINDLPFEVIPPRPKEPPSDSSLSSVPHWIFYESVRNPCVSKGLDYPQMGSSPECSVGVNEPSRFEIGEANKHLHLVPFVDGKPN